MSTEAELKIDVAKLMDSRMLITVIGLAVTAGGSGVMLTAHGQSIEDNSEAIGALAESVTDHTFKGGHTLTGAKVGELERRIAQLEVKVEGVRDAMAEQDATLAAICAATGARCP